MKQKHLALGIDFGTDSVRALIVNTADGHELANAVSCYPRWKQGLYCSAPDHQFRQHPLDYTDCLISAVRGALKAAGKYTASYISGMGIDTTGSTPVAVDRSGTPLALIPEFSGNPNAMFVLWKDHTAVKEAQEINAHAKSWKGGDYTKYCGGVYSSEWFWSKILHILRTDKKVSSAAFSWVEQCDWLPALLSGNTDPLFIKRSRCAAGHKAMWHEKFGGLPDEKFLIRLDPLFTGIKNRLYKDTFTADRKIGELSVFWADKLGLRPGIAIAGGAFDAHMGAVGGGIEPYALFKVMGTSTCDMLVVPAEELNDKPIEGICGQVNGSVIPGMIGLEAGQSAFGDVYAWFKKLLEWPFSLAGKSDVFQKKKLHKLLAGVSESIIPGLAKKAAELPASETGIFALDWFNGRRTPYANQLLTGAIMGLDLGSDAPRIFRALVEATACGAKKIIERFEEEGITVKKIIALGGIAQKSEFIMQTVSDVLNRPIKVVKSEQACALGAAMFGATAAGIFKKVQNAQAAMTGGFSREYKPNKKKAHIHDKNYKLYSRAGKFFENLF